MAHMRREISRAFVRAMSIAESIRSILHPSGPGPVQLRARQARPQAPFLSWVLSLILVFQTCALPIPLAFLLISADAETTTEGCATKTCCTALCYVDKNGVHHCVHKHEDSCECDVSIHDRTVNPILYSTIGTLPIIDQLLPDLIPEVWISQIPASVKNHRPATPSLPPK
jgi:hypothetical protein